MIALYSCLRRTWTVAVLVLLTVAFATTAAAATQARVTVGSPTSPFPRNKQNEPAVAIDASRPAILAAGSNDEIDNAPCGTTVFATEESPCPFTPGVGDSGIYFSFNNGASWVQPTYTGWSARTGTPQVGPIGTIPWYYENGLVSDGDPAVAFGPIQRNGEFSWANGSRLYYANLTSNFPASLYASGATPRELDEEEAPERNMALREQGFAEPGAVKGVEGIAVSRADNVTEANYNDKNVWKPPVIASKAASNTQFADKEQVWADNAESSSFFGNVYVCYAQFVGGGAAPLIVATSRDGGSTWDQKQVSSAAARSPKHFGQSGCTIRTNSHGVVYVMYQSFQALSLPGASGHYLVRSYDGGTTWTRPQLVTTLFDNCFVVDPVIGRCVEDGIAGARNDLSASPNIDIANGAPSGAGAPNTIVDNYVTGPALNQEKVYVTWAGANEEAGRVSPGQAPSLTWSEPQQVSETGDRGLYTAPAFSPDGSKLYVVYNAYTTPYRDTTFTSRGLVGVFRSATMSASGPSAWSTLHRSPVGDPRASSQNNLQAEFLGDYVYADATNTYGIGVWNDVRGGAVCDAINEWRMDLRTETDAGDPPNPVDACLAGFGDTDIWAYTTG
jgi:hypothetical protein